MIVFFSECPPPPLSEGYFQPRVIGGQRKFLMYAGSLTSFCRQKGLAASAATTAARVGASQVVLILIYVTGSLSCRRYGAA